MKINAKGKINLYLDVQGRREDGYHEIRSILTPITLADKLIIEPSDGELELDAPRQAVIDGMSRSMPLGTPRENLVYKAAALLREVAGCRCGARITLEKYIPVAAGLGGGSADAAAVLTVLNKLWKVNMPLSELLELAGRIGCDVPALTHGGAVCARGRGEDVRAVKWRVGWRPWLLLINPGFGVSTRDIYNRYRQDLTSPPRKDTFAGLLAAMEAGNLEGLAGGLYNALQRTVFDKYPLLEMIFDRLTGSGEAALLSGSGATIFVLTRDAAYARALAVELRQSVNFRLWVRLAQIVGDAGLSPDTGVGERHVVCVPGDCPMV